MATCMNAELVTGYRSAESRESASLPELKARQDYIDGKLEQLPRLSMRSGSGVIGFRTKGIQRDDSKEWIEIHLDQPADIDCIVLVPAIWRSMADGFLADGFPLRFRIQAGMEGDRVGRTVFSATGNEAFLPRAAPVFVPTKGIRASWVRLEAQMLSRRFIDNRAVLQMAEILLFSGQTNVALGQRVSVSSSQDAFASAWHKDYLVDGFMPYLINSAKGGQSVAYISSIVDRPSLVVDLGREYPVSELHLHPVEQGDTVPQAYSGTFGLPQRLRVSGSLRKDFKDPVQLHEMLSDGRTEYGPFIARRFGEISLRYLKFEGSNDINPAAVLPEQDRLGFAEIEIFSGGRNVALGRTVYANHEPNSGGRTLEALTDGKNLYGEIRSVREWLEGLAYRHELETELPLVTAELGLRYDRQKFRLSLMTWVAAVCVACVGFVILMERNLRLKQADRIRRRIAANLHDELGADLHAIGLLGDHASNVVDSREELIDTVNRIRLLTVETGSAARHCTNMLESSNDLNNFITEMKRVASRLMADTDYAFSIEGEEHMTRLKPRRKIDLMLFHKECLMNVIRHSDATSVRSSLSATPGMVHLEVTDNGIGQTPAGRVPPSLLRRAKLMRAEVTCGESSIGGVKIHLSLRMGLFQALL
jgi:signal transduction histidine kinase